MVGGDAGKEKDQGTVADMSHVWGLTWVVVVRGC